MKKEETLEQLKEIIKPYTNNKEAFDNFTADTDFIADLNINSANLVDIILDVEDAFKIHIDNESMEKMLDVKSTLEIIEAKLSEKVIGNDIVDLALARKQSNWKRTGFLDKIFTVKEQLLIANAENPEIMVWNLWSRKEAAYKIYNRQTGIRLYIPIQLECFYENEYSGSVRCRGNTYYTKTEISKAKIATVAVIRKSDFKEIIVVKPTAMVHKKNGVPYLLDANNLEKPFSISHHGRFATWVSLK